MSCESSGSRVLFGAVLADSHHSAWTQGKSVRRLSTYFANSLLLETSRGLACLSALPFRANSAVLSAFDTGSYFNAGYRANILPFEVLKVPNALFHLDFGKFSAEVWIYTCLGSSLFIIV